MKVGIVGSGFVGATAAYAMVMRGVGREIILVDRNERRAQAEADDILHAVPFAHSLNVRAGGFADLHGSDVVVLTAGVNQQPEETRLQLLARNADVFREVVPAVLTHAPDAVLVVASNPVDVMTHFTACFAAEHGVPQERVIGSGTTLDTARFRALLSRRLGVDPPHVHAYVLGEHGDSEVLTWSMVTVGGLPLEEFGRQRGVLIDDDFRAETDQNVRRAAYSIIGGKGATYYGVGSALAHIVDVVLADKRAILTVCSRVSSVCDVEDVTVALPHLIGGAGVMATLPLSLPEHEENALRDSARIVRGAIEALSDAGSTS